MGKSIIVDIIFLILNQKRFKMEDSKTMKLRNENEVMTIFSDISMEDLKQLIEINAKTILVLTNDREVKGVFDRKLFWKNFKLDTEKQTVEDFLDTSFQTYFTFRDIKKEDVTSYNYAIIKKDYTYFCLSMKDVKILKLENEINSLLNTNNSFVEQLETIRESNKELKQILHSTYDEIFVTDAKGNTLFVSEACKKLTGLPPEAFIGKNVKDLDEKGIIVNSVTLKTMKSKAVSSAEQTYPNGVTVLTTAKPIFDENGQLYRIVSNSRDISDLVKIKHELQKMASKQTVQGQNRQYEATTFYYKGLITTSPNMLKVLDLAKKVAKIDSSVLITGDSGVGKGILARMIHELSLRKNNKFIHVNCGAIPSSLIESELFGYEAGAFTGATNKGKKGLVELANRGTLFLDEIGEMPMDMQVKLLHLVQEKKFMRIGGTKEITVDIRIISATNKNLLQMVSENKFREDLYYRIHVVPLKIPPLRDRKEDILLLIDYFLYIFNQKYNRAVSLDYSAKLTLQLHDFPGNVRELENLVEQIVVTASNSIISVQDLPLTFKNASSEESASFKVQPLKQIIDDTEKRVISFALERYKTTRELANALQVSQTTIMRKLKKYNLSTRKKVK